MKRAFLGAVVRLAAAAALVGSPAAQAQQDYPNRPIKLLIGFAAGGPTDVIARAIAQDMSASLGQSVVVENRPGANSLIATEAVARAAPDGYTLIFASLSHNVNPLLSKNAKYDPLKDFTPISNVAVLPLVLVTQPTAPFNSVKELVQQAKAQPGSLSFGSAGNGGSAHLAGELLQTMGGAQMTHVPYKGNAPALTDVIGGQVSFMFYPVVGIADQVAQKRLKVLAVASPKRLPEFPDAPTMAEAGFPGFDETAPWVGMLAPAGTPPAVVNRLHEAVAKSLANAATRDKLRALGAIVVGDTPQQFAAYLRADADRWARVIKSAGLKAE